MTVYRVEYNLVSGHNSKELKLDYDQDLDVWVGKDKEVIPTIPNIKREPHKIVIWGFNEGLIKKAMKPLANKLLEDKSLEVSFYYE